MDRTEYIKRMKEHENEFDMLWMKIVEDTNEFISSNPKSNAAKENSIKKMIDSICLSGAWIMDRLNGKYPKDRRSLTRKVRRALGYTIP